MTRERGSAETQSRGYFSCFELFIPLQRCVRNRSTEKHSPVHMNEFTCYCNCQLNPNTLNWTSEKPKCWWVDVLRTKTTWFSSYCFLNAPFSPGGKVIAKGPFNCRLLVWGFALWVALCWSKVFILSIVHEIGICFQYISLCISWN